MPAVRSEPVTSLYVHVPFCAHKCEYCAFYSEAAHGELINRYVAALVGELELVAADLQPGTIFFGGGTPSLLNLKQWQTIFTAMDRLNVLGAQEWTIECNPATVSLEKARLWRDHGVNRVSMGVQSFNDALLDRLGRIHSRGMVFRSFEVLRQAGFDNVNLDLMFAIPGQTMQVWQETLEQALALGSEHLSCYEVIYEEDTPLFEQLKAGRFSVDEDLACAMYEELVDRLSSGGFVQYEIANFARDESARSPEPDIKDGPPSPQPPPPGEGNGFRAPDESLFRSSPNARSRDSLSLGERVGVRASPVSNSAKTSRPLPSGATYGAEAIPHRACRHNVNYWRGGSYHGLGPSAAGYVRGQRTKNWSNTRLYCEQLERGRPPVEWREELPPLQRAGEIAAFGLRMNAGWPFEPFRQVTGFDLRAEWPREIEHLVERGWGAIEDHGFRLTRRGLRFADAAAELFLT